MAEVKAVDAGFPFYLYGVGTRLKGVMYDTSGAPVTSPTGLAGKISTDSDTPGDTTNTPVATGNGGLYIDLTAAEMTHTQLHVTVTSTSENACQVDWILEPRPLPLVHSGTAQAGAAGSLTLSATGAQTTSHAYNGYALVLTGGTGAGQARPITSYNGATLVAAVTPNWTTTPSSDTTYEVRQADLALRVAALANVVSAQTVADLPGPIADAVWDEARADHVAAGSYGESFDPTATESLAAMVNLLFHRFLICSVITKDGSGNGVLVVKDAVGGSTLTTVNLTKSGLVTSLEVQ
jgi:hypothetical protein